MTIVKQQIDFQNTSQPNSSFDLLHIQELFNRKEIDHDIDANHRLDFYLLLIVTEGHGFHHIDFQEYKLQKGSILSIRKDQIHRFDRRKRFDGYLLLFKDIFIVSYLEAFEANKSLQFFNELLASPLLQLKKNELGPILSLVQNMNSEYSSDFDSQTLSIIRSQLHILISLLFRYKLERTEIKVDHVHLNDFIQFQSFIEQNHITHHKVIDYGKMMGKSTKTLNNITQSIVNKPAKELIDDIRLTSIKRLLLYSQKSISEIAFESGFNEPTNFYKFFKRLMNTTPENYRKK